MCNTQKNQYERVFIIHCIAGGYLYQLPVCSTQGKKNDEEILWVQDKKIFTA
jgi:hypothetical protein